MFWDELLVECKVVFGGDCELFVLLYFDGYVLYWVDCIDFKLVCVSEFRVVIVDVYCVLWWVLIGFDFME